MPIRPPRLDDRRYADLVEELLARIPAHAPEYTDPRPGDPGRTLIELFAWLTDTLLYRANLIPERQRLAFLRLLGVPGVHLRTTSLTALVRVERAVVTGPGGGAPPARGYVNHRYEARVLETYRGPVMERVTYEVMADADLRPVLPPYPLIVSLCGPVGDRYYVPDNGYVTPATPGLVELARRTSRRGGFPAPSACSTP